VRLEGRQIDRDEDVDRPRHEVFGIEAVARHQGGIAIVVFGSGTFLGSGSLGD
jgi:hypothetical protein